MNAQSTSASKSRSIIGNVLTAIVCAAIIGAGVFSQSSANTVPVQAPVPATVNMKPAQTPMAIDVPDIPEGARHVEIGDTVIMDGLEVSLNDVSVGMDN